MRRLFIAFTGRKFWMPGKLRAVKKPIDAQMELALLTKKFAKLSSSELMLHRHEVIGELRLLICREIHELNLHSQGRALRGRYGQGDITRQLIQIRDKLDFLVRHRGMSPQLLLNNLADVINQLKKVFVHIADDGRTITVGTGTTVTHTISCECGSVTVTSVGGDDGDDGDEEADKLLALIKFYLKKCRDKLNDAVLDARLGASQAQKQSLACDSLRGVMQLMSRNIVPNCIKYGKICNASEYEVGEVCQALVKVGCEVMGGDSDGMLFCERQAELLREALAYPCREDNLKLDCGIPDALQQIVKMIAGSESDRNAIINRLDQLDRHVVNKINEVKRIVSGDVTEARVDKRTVDERRQIDEVVEAYLTDVIKAEDKGDQVNLRPYCKRVYWKWKKLGKPGRCNSVELLYERARYDLKEWYNKEAMMSDIRLKLKGLAR